MQVVLANIKGNKSNPKTIKFSKRSFYEMGESITSIREPIHHEDIESVYVIRENKFQDMPFDDFLKSFQNME